MLWRRRKEREQDLERELRTHLELEAAEQQEKGLPIQEARYAAERALGNTTLIKEDVRTMWTWVSIERLIQDARYALRTTRKNPVYSFFAVLIMALGIGSTTLMFTVVNSLLFQPPPFKDPDALFMLWQKIPQEDRISFSPRNFAAYSKQAQVLQNLAAFTGNGFTILGRGEPELALGQLVTPSFFKILGVHPSLGRNFLASEGEPGNNHEVILSDQLWRSKFGARPDVIGKSVVMNGEPYTIVGVMPEAFDFPSRDYKLWVPAALNAPLFQQHADAHFLRVLAQLKPGFSLQQLQAEADILGRRIDKEEQDTNRRYYAVSLREMLNENLRRPLFVLLFAVSCLLLIACANVANLMLARASVRQREIAVRGAIGASRWRLIQQLLIESTLVALMGGIVGFVFAYGGLRLLTTLGTKSVPQLVHAHIDLSAPGFAFLLSAASGILFGLVPGLAASRVDFQTALKEGSRATGSIRSDRTRSALVVAEIALALILLVCSGLMIRSFISLLHVNPGFRVQETLAADVAFLPNHYPDAASILRFYRNTLAGIRQLPGVSAAGMITHLPFGGNDWGNSFEVEGQPARRGIEYTAQIRPVSPGYFNAIGIPLQRGREFTDRDNETALRVAIVNELLAKQFWPNESPLGKQIRFDRDWLTIVGVCGNTKHLKLDAASKPEIYTPYPQLPPQLIQFVGRENNYVVHFVVNPGTMASSIRARVHALDPEMVVKVNTMESLVSDSVAQPRFRTWLVVIFSVLALTLTSVGIFGVVAYSVTQRYKEFGIRIALGAERGKILQLVLAHTMKLALIAIAVGVSGAFLFSRFLKSLLFGITVHDPLTFVSVPVLLIAVALLASYLPARRATRVDPMATLRHE